MNDFTAMAARGTASKIVDTSDLPELTQAFLVWYEANEGRPLANANYELINESLRMAQARAKRFTRKAVHNLMIMGIAFEDIEPLIEEGIFIFAHEVIRPSVIQGSAKTYDAPTSLMLEYFYSVNLVRA